MINLRKKQDMKKQYIKLHTIFLQNLQNKKFLLSLF